MRLYFPKLNIVLVFLMTLNSSWSSEGCTVFNNSSPERTICSCNHLTNFAVLMQFKEEEVGVTYSMNELVCFLILDLRRSTRQNKRNKQQTKRRNNYKREKKSWRRTSLILVPH